MRAVPSQLSDSRRPGKRASGVPCGLAHLLRTGRYHAAATSEPSQNVPLPSLVTFDLDQTEVDE